MSAKRLLKKSNIPINQKKRHTVKLVSLGCAKNQVDLETIAGNMKNAVFTDNPETADLIIINTCAFIRDAKEESVNGILSALKIKEEAQRIGRSLKVVVTGCLSERYKQTLKKELPEVDAFFGVQDQKRLVRYLGDSHFNDLNRRLLNAPHYAYLKISEGCNRRCGFCAIPSIRGRLKSRSIHHNLDQARRLAESGVRELIVIAQDTTAYGHDFKNRGKSVNHHLIRLLEKLTTIEGIEWIRLMYLYPSAVSDELIGFIAAHPKLCKYFELPIQHISDHVLKTMRRGTASRTIRRVLERIRTVVPEAAVRTTVITGHPGETAADFRELYRFIESFQFERLGVFPYSDEEGTHSYALRPKTAEKTKFRRAEEIMLLQQEISLKKNHALIGVQLPVIIDVGADGAYTGRTQWDAPEIDNTVIIHTSQNITAGRILNAVVTAADAYDLYAQIKP